jgi:hypothetical protein
MNTLLSNWSFMRLFRAGIAIWIFVEIWRTGEWLLLAPGSIFALQAIFNVGCCGANGCASPQQRNYASETEDVTYEELR